MAEEGYVHKQIFVKPSVFDDLLLQAHREKRYTGDMLERMIFLYCSAMEKKALIETAIKKGDKATERTMEGIRETQFEMTLLLNEIQRLKDKPEPSPCKDPAHTNYNPTRDRSRLF